MMVKDMSKVIWIMKKTLKQMLGEGMVVKGKTHQDLKGLYPYTAERRDVLGCTSPTTERCPEGEARGTSRGPREISRSEGFSTIYIPTRGSVRTFSHH